MCHGRHRCGGFWHGRAPTKVAVCGWHGRRSRLDLIHRYRGHLATRPPQGLSRQDGTAQNGETSRGPWQPKDQWVKSAIGTSSTRETDDEVKCRRYFSICKISATCLSKHYSNGYRPHPCSRLLVTRSSIKGRVWRPLLVTISLDPKKVVTLIFNAFRIVHFVLIQTNEDTFSYSNWYRDAKPDFTHEFPSISR